MFLTSCGEEETAGRISGRNSQAPKCQANKNILAMELRYSILKTFLQPIYQLWYLSVRKRSLSVAPVSAHSPPRHRDVDTSVPPIQRDETVIIQTLAPHYP